MHHILIRTATGEIKIAYRAGTVGLVVTIDEVDVVSRVNVDRDVMTVKPPLGKADVVTIVDTPVVRKVVATSSVVKLAAPTLCSSNDGLEKFVSFE